MNFADIPILGAFFAKKNHRQAYSTLDPDVVTLSVDGTPVSISKATYAGKIIDLTVTGATTITLSSTNGWTDKDWVIFRIVSNVGAFSNTFVGGGTLTATNDEGKLKQSKGSVYAEVVGTNIRHTGKLST